MRGVRCVSVFNNATGSGFAVGSIEGRVDIKDLSDLTQGKKSFAFKCHRIKQENNARNAKECVL